MGSLRTRLFLFLTGGSALLLVVAGLALTTTIGGWLETEFDRGLLVKARALAALTDQEAGRVELDFDSRVLPEFAVAEGAEYFELWLAGGPLLARSPSFRLVDGGRAAGLVRDARPAEAPRFRDVQLPDGRRGRQVRLDFVPAADSEDEALGADLRADHREPAPAAPGTQATGGGAAVGVQVSLIVAREREGLDADLWRLRLGVGLLAVILMVALGAITHLTLRVGLRSLDHLTGQVQALDVASLGERVRLRGPPTEIAVVTEQVNALLDRLEVGFQRERQLSADIAHELKTPIAELRTLCEVGARWPDDPEHAEKFFEDAGAIARQMERIVVHLLALARCDERKEPVWTRRVRVAEVVEQAWQPLAREAEAKRLKFRPSIDPGLSVDTDPDKLELMLANLFSNAMTYSPPDTAVDCVAGVNGAGVAVTVSNLTDNLDASDLPLLFDRFWRKDPARASGRHAGLGLSLVRALADLLAIELTTRLDPDRTLRVTLSCRAAG